MRNGKRYFAAIALGGIFAACFLPGLIAQSVEVYLGPGGDAYHSNLYRVAVEDQNRWLDSYTYHVSRKSVTSFKASDGGNPSVNFTTFGINDAALVRVGKLRGSIRSVQISPKSKAIVATIRMGEAFIQVHPNDKLWIVIDDDVGHPLFVFADPLKPAMPPGATYYGPGVHDIGLARKTIDGETIYLDGGAWVTGTFDLRDRSRVTIMGPGVLSGEKWPSELIANVRSKEDYCMIIGSGALRSRDNRIEDITIVEAPFYNITRGPEYIGNVKLLSPWYWSTDGFQVLPRGPGRLALIERCFAFVGDDVFFPRENFRGDIEVRDCFVSSTNNSIFQICYWGNPLEHDHRAYLHGIDIKNFLPRHNSALFRASIDNATGTGVKNMTFEDIRIEGDLVCPLLQIENREYFWPAQSSHPETKLGNTSNMVFRNITATVPEDRSKSVKSTLLGLDEKNGHHHYLFQNVQINGTVLTDANYRDFITLNQFTSDVRFTASPP